MPRVMSSGGFQPPPPFTKSLLMLLLGLYVVELIASSWLGIPLSQLLGWHPGVGFELWQPITCFFIQGGSPISAMLNLLMVYFFIPPIQMSFGRKGVIRLAAITVGISIFFCSLAIVTGAINASIPFMGIDPFITAAIVVFGLTRPKAQILIFFVLPIQAAWIAWGTGLLASLNFLFSRDIGSAMWLGGWLGGYLFMRLPKKGGMSSILTHLRHSRTQQKLRKFTVIDGGADDTYH
jgi:hypothetical protein